MPKAIVLGCGMVGSVMATDLAGDEAFEVTVADTRAGALEAAVRRAAAQGRTVETVEVDWSDAGTLTDLIGPYDIVLGAMASTIGFASLRTIIEAGKNFCDITFMPEDAIDLDELARERGVTAVVDCGVAPGMSNLLAGYGASLLDECKNIEIYVGGLPRERRWPFEYKAGFSPYDVVEEYTRPSRIVENGEVVVREALSEPELMDFDGIGTLESFNTDGLRSLARTMRVPFMKEKTLRYPGHIELMRVFRETGLFGHEPIEVGGVKVRPIDVISALMFPKWTYEEGEEDLTVMRVTVSGCKDGRCVQHTWDLLDYYDQETRATSMSRTTAFPCSIMARLVGTGAFERPGVINPELIGPDAAIVDQLIREQAERGVVYTHRVEEVEASG